MSTPDMSIRLYMNMDAGGDTVAGVIKSTELLISEGLAPLLHNVNLMLAGTLRYSR